MKGMLKGMLITRTNTILANGNNSNTNNWEGNQYSNNSITTITNTNKSNKNHYHKNKMRCMRHPQTTRTYKPLG